MFRYYPLLLALLLSVSVNAQKLSESRTSSLMTYIYKLNPDQVRMLANWKITISDTSLFKNLVDSFPTDSSFSKTLNPGSYCFVKAAGEEMEFELKLVNNLHVITSSNIPGLWVNILDNDGNPISDAEVYLNDKRLDYSPGQMIYQSDKKLKKRAVLFIRKGEECSIFQIDPEYLSYYDDLPWSYKIREKSRSCLYALRYRARYRHSNKKDYSGFVVFNKPKYQPSDTLRCKAYVSSKKGNPYKGSVRLRIPRDRYNRNTFILDTVLKPVSPGAFVFDFPLRDSLKTSVRHYLSVTTFKGSHLIGSEFSVEDYQLEKIRYKAECPGKLFLGIDTICLKVEGFDMNRQRIQDGKCQVTLKSTDIDNLYELRAMVKDTLYISNSFLEPDSPTLIKIPVSVLPPVEQKIDVIINFSNSNNETGDTTFSIKVDNSKEFIKTIYRNGYLETGYYLNGKSVQRDAVISGYREIEDLDDADSIFTRNVQLPFRYKPAKLVTDYLVESGEQSEDFNMKELLGKGFDDFENVRSIEEISLSGFRRNDSVFFNTANPYKIEFTYRILKNNKVVESGISKELDKIIPAADKCTYSLFINYISFGEEKSCYQKVYYFKNYLNVKVETEDEISPGDKGKMSVHVTDDEGKPVEKANLTAWAVNSQSGNLKAPLFGTTFKGKVVNNGSAYRASKQEFEQSSFLGRWKEKIVLNTPYYDFLLHEDGVKLFYEASLTGNTEFAPFIISKGKIQPVSLISFNKRLVYNALTADQDYSFLANAGYHTVVVRTKDKRYTISNVLFKAGQKLLLSLSLDSLPANVKVEYIGDRYTAEEADLINATTVSIKNTFYGKEFFIKSGQKVMEFNGKYYDQYLVGPVNPGTFLETTITDGFQNEFSFEPGYQVELREKTIVLRPFKIVEAGEAVRIKTRRELGDFALRPVEIKMKSSVDKRIDFSSMPYRTEKGNGEIIYFNRTDTGLAYISLWQAGSPENNWILSPSTNTIRNLAPGSYNLIFHSDFNHHVFYDNIHVERDATTCFELPKGAMVNDTCLSFDERNALLKENNLNSSYSFGTASLTGTVTDRANGEPLPFAPVVISKFGKTIASSQTNFDGEFTIKNISPGKYVVKASSVGYNPVEMVGVILNEGRRTRIDLKMESNPGMLQEVVIMSYCVPLIDPDTKSGCTVTRENFSQMATKNVLSVACSVAGVVQQDEGREISVRGSRSPGAATEVYVDGVKVRGSSAIPQSAVDQVSFEDEKPTERTPQKSLRSNFRDYAFWAPDFLTDSKGYAQVSFEYPDNITRWDGAVVGVDKSKRKGINTFSVYAKKKIAAELAVPRFLISGDKARIVAKVSNYSGEKLPLKTDFTVSGNEFRKDTGISNFYVQKELVTTDTKDTLDVSFLVNAGRFNDGEKQRIPVLKAGVNESSGYFTSLRRDTSITWHFDRNGEIKVAAFSNPFDLILDDLKKLEKYPYMCNEQKASKLMGLLCQREIYKMRGMKFSKEKDIRLLIKRLEKDQNEDGSWGWWSGGDGDAWITSYVLQSLVRAEKANYSSASISKGLNYLVMHIGEMKDKLLPVLKTLAENKKPADYPELIKKAAADTSLEADLYRARILQLSGETPDIPNIISKSKRNMFGGMYWKSGNRSFKSNTLYLTTLAYEILRDDSIGKKYTDSIDDYFFSERRNNGEWNNTLEVARIASLIVEKLDTVKRNNSTFIVNGKEYVVGGSPVTIKTESDKLDIKTKTVSPLFISATQQKWNYLPEKVAGDFEVNTELIQHGEKVDSVMAGIPLILKVKVQVKKKAEYVMMEVPIPAGCFYDVKKQSHIRREHKEYYKDKTNIYVEIMQPGNYEYEINLQPRFEGVYTLNPATVSLMYYPTFFGREGMKEVSIAD